MKPQKHSVLNITMNLEEVADLLELSRSHAEHLGISGLEHRLLDITQDVLALVKVIKVRRGGSPIPPPMP